MKRTRKGLLLCIVFCILLGAAFFAGCTGTAPQTAAATSVATPGETTAASATTKQTPADTPSGKTLIVYTAASLTGVSKELGKEFSALYPGYNVVFNLAGTQALKTQVENGAYADVFISASNSYTKTLKEEGYFINSTVKPLTANYVIVILPVSNPGNITSLADLAVPGKKIAMAAANVPIGTASYAALANLANSTYGSAWNKSVFNNVVTYETTEPGVVTKVSLGEVDAGLVYESSYAGAPAGTLTAISIPREDNYLQTYTIGILEKSENGNLSQEFEDFMLSDTGGQKILKDYGFRPIA